MAKTTVKLLQFPHLEQALDQASYEWLTANEPTLILALEKDIEARPEATAIQIRQWMVGKYNREELGLRIEQAARHIKRGQVA